MSEEAVQDPIIAEKPIVGASKDVEEKITELINEGHGIEEYEKYMDLLHKYNKYKDQAQHLIGTLAQVGRVVLFISDVRDKKNKSLDMHGKTGVIKDIIDHNNVVVQLSDIKIKPFAVNLRHIQALSMLISEISKDSSIKEINKLMNEPSYAAKIKSIQAVKSLTRRNQIKKMNDFQRYVYKRMNHLKAKTVREEVTKLGGKVAA
ncbi:MAG: swi5-like zinc finger protein [Paramarteilia canceri]